MKDLKYDQVLKLCDGRLTQAEVAEKVGCSYSYVSIVLQRNVERHGPKRSVKRVPTGPRPVGAVALSAVRQMVAMEGATFRAIRDHAEARRVGIDDIAGTLLAAAVEEGFLERFFPVKEGAA